MMYIIWNGYYMSPNGGGINGFSLVSVPFGQVNSI